ncbi:unnamed protein product [Larinioides sclopetarius]|uniref:DUF19 domain-containing protein n=1 Tax=Larinioides sclopetarius TaxID=280406 RepID=A0AAV1ZF06_9ARAC
MFPKFGKFAQVMPTLQFLNCKTRALEDCDELVTASNTNLSILTKYSMNLENIVKDICNESSSFHKNYVSNINCYKKVYFKLIDYCWIKFNKTRHHFIKYLDFSDGNANPLKCLLMESQDACVAERFQVFCGESARRIYLRTLRVFHGIFSLPCGTIGEEWRLEFSNFSEEM